MYMMRGWVWREEGERRFRCSCFWEDWNWEIMQPTIESVRRGGEEEGRGRRRHATWEKRGRPSARTFFTEKEKGDEGGENVKRGLVTV